MPVFQYPQVLCKEKEAELQSVTAEAIAASIRAREANRHKTKKALVIGMSYKGTNHTLLRNTVNDATDMCDLLKRA
jgi:hypothetical protein